MAKMSFENHIMKQFDEELEEIRTRLMEMGGKVEEQLQNAILAISDANSQLAEQVILARPRMILTVDNKGFSIQFAMRLRRRMRAVGWSAPIIHCVAPTVWAWGRWRAQKFANTLDGLLCLFPFEPEYFHNSRFDTHFIGHPEAFKNYQPKKSVQDKKSVLRRIILLPGSRQSEIKLILIESVLRQA